MTLLKFDISFGPDLNKNISDFMRDIFGGKSYSMK